MKALPFTGERYVPEVDGEIRLEHLHRYAWARDLVVGLDVLDIASGEGYGSAILSETAKSVIGVDISEPAVLHARQRYGAVASFSVGSTSEVPLEDSSVDAVVSFETIEHVHCHISMMKEIKRVLKPNGFLIISSPDKEIYSDKAGYVNEFHVSELTLSDFKELLDQSFKHVHVFGQRISACSALIRLFLDKDEGTGIFYSENNDGTIHRGIIDKVDCKYIVSVASDSTELLPEMSESALISRKTDIGSDKSVLDKRNEYLKDLDELTKKAYQSEPALRVTLSSVFDDGYYAMKYGLSCKSRLELAMHYLTIGEKAGLMASEFFSPTAYLAANPDAKDYAMGPLCHYLDFGMHEGRKLSCDD